MSSITDWLNSIIAKIASLPGLIFEKFSDALTNIKNAVGAVAKGIYVFFEPFITFVKEKLKSVLDFLKSIIDFLGGIGKAIFDVFADTLQSIIDGILGIPKAIFNFIKRIFIPEDGFIEDAKEKLKIAFSHLLIEYDLTSLISGEKPISDITCTLYGQKVTILDSSIVVKGINAFRHIVRGFIVLMLILFNINQFLALIGQPTISQVLGGAVASSNDTQGGGKGGTE